MHWTLVIAVFPVLFVLTAATGEAGDRPGNGQIGSGHTVAPGNNVVPGIVVVKLKRATALPGPSTVHGAQPVPQAMSLCGVTSLVRAFPMVTPVNDAVAAAGKVDLSRIHFAGIPPGMDPVATAARLAALPDVQYAEPKYYASLCTVPNDSAYARSQQVYFDRMEVPAGWDLQKGRPEIVIATVDGGTNWRHPDLAANVWINSGEDLNHDGAFTEADSNGVDDDHNGYVDDVVGWNFGNNTNNPRGFLPVNANHGTETASAFGAVTNNACGIAGTSWNCRIMPVCVSDPATDKEFPFGPEGIVYAYMNGARIINCSWQRGVGRFSRYEQDVITAATQAGALVVAAAGNSHHQDLDDLPSYPASYEHVLSVGATMDTSDEIPSWTNLGLNVSVFAPGCNIYEAKDNGSYGTDGGTSHSSPLVAGLAGLLLAAHPGWTPEQIAAQIRITADPIDGRNPAFAGSLGHGRVNFRRALSEVHAGVTANGGRFLSPSGRQGFQEGDTVTLSAKVRNVLTRPAENLSFDVSADPPLIPLGPVVGPRRLDAGAQGSLDCAFRVGRVAQKRDVHFRLSWCANGDERDAHMFTTTVYAGEGFWEHQKSPTTIALYGVHAVNSRVAWAAGFSQWTPLKVVLKTTDGGETWAAVTNDLVGWPTCIAAVDSLRAWVGGSGGGISATVDGGASWREQNYPSPQSSFIKGLRFFDAANGYAFGDPGSSNTFVILRTTDGGTSWTHLANEPAGTAGSYVARAFSCTDRQHIWFGAPPSLLWRTSDGGGTWSSVSMGTGELTALTMRDDSVGIACSVSGTNDETLFFARTVDGGATWQTLAEVKPEGGFMAAFAPRSTDAWVVGRHTVACSRDNGRTWALQPTEPVDANLASIAFADSATGWIVADNGDILRYRGHAGSLIAVREAGAAVPAHFTLYQNYPNPFNPSTVIAYALPCRTPVRLSVFNAIGQKIADLINGQIDAGYHEVLFSAAGLASGVYFYRLQAGTFAQTRSLVILR